MEFLVLEIIICLNDPGWQIAQACEAILLSSGLADEAYQRYALEANQGITNLATFRAIAKKYPNKQPEEILRDLIASTPGAEGKWFAAAKDAGLFDVAIELATRSPTDPRTLTRAARDFAEKQPKFALEAALAALGWIVRGYGYEITGADVLDAHAALERAAASVGIDNVAMAGRISSLLAEGQPHSDFVRKILRYRLPR